MQDAGEALYRFRKPLRLLNSNDYTTVFHEAAFRISHKNFLLLARLNQSALPRLGLIVAKKNIRRAVQRNRIKRLSRETFRLQQSLLTGVDVILLARSGMDELENNELIQLLNKQWSALQRKVIKNREKQHALVNS